MADEESTSTSTDAESTLRIPRMDIPPVVEVFYPSSQAYLQRWQFLPRSEFMIEYQCLPSSWNVRVSLRRWNRDILLRYELKIQTAEQRCQSSLIWYGSLHYPHRPPIYHRLNLSDRPATHPPPPPPLRDAFDWSLRCLERDAQFLHRYYHCVHTHCQARKTVKSSDSGHHLIIIYHDNHTHDAPRHS